MDVRVDVLTAQLQSQLDLAAGARLCHRNHDTRAHLAEDRTLMAGTQLLVTVGKGYNLMLTPWNSCIVLRILA